PDDRAIHKTSLHCNSLHSDGVRDRLYARAVAFSVDGERAVLVSCDLIGVSAPITRRVREKVSEAMGLPPDRIMVHAIHTHSGPAVRVYSGWGTPDPVYLELLPGKIAKACVEAVDALQDATLAHAEVPCRGIATNRRLDMFSAKTVEEVLDPDWQPPHPEMTDTTAHVFRVDDADGRLVGFFSYYGCHPVIGGPGCLKIHGDWPGIASNLVERLHPGATGFFLQGAQGDINACRVCSEEADALRVLDAVGARYARVILRGLEEAEPLTIDRLAAAQHHVAFGRKPWDRAKLAALLAEQEAVLGAPEASDDNRDVRMAMVYAQALRSLLERLDRGEGLSPPEELHGLRVGPVAFLGGPFEIFRAIKNDVVAAAAAKIPLVMGLTNNSIGYAFDHLAAEAGGYEPDRVPFICRQLPFANIHDELAQGLLEVDRALG
ncbi:MAG: neutral/alkaline non-lysosomal ceramidase N-terminal domain-containing protein, partial [Planctomycetota bacterium]